LVLQSSRVALAAAQTSRPAPKPVFARRLGDPALAERGGLARACANERERDVHHKDFLSLRRRWPSRERETAGILPEKYQRDADDIAAARRDRSPRVGRSRLLKSGSTAIDHERRARPTVTTVSEDLKPSVRRDVRKAFAQ
jgi:hypothetical protein